MDNTGNQSQENNMNLKIPQTAAEKIEVLKEARKKLESGWTRGYWYQLIEGTESYCLYGALEAAMGFDFKTKLTNRMIESESWGVNEELTLEEYIMKTEPSFMSLDEEVSTCSLTSTMFDASGLIASPGTAASYLRAVQDGENPYEGWDRYTESAKQNAIMDLKVRALQSLNDNGTKEDVLRVIDAAIEYLQAEVDA